MENRTFSRNSFEADFFVGKRSRRYGVCSNINFIILSEQIRRCLIYTNMGFNSANQNLLAAMFFKFAVKFLAAAAAEARFVYRLVVCEQLRDFRYCRPQRRGNLLAP